MTEFRSCEEIRNVVAASIRDRSLLRVPIEAKRIARLSGGCPQAIARHLADAGIRAGLDVEFGAPERRSSQAPAEEPGKLSFAV